MKGHPKYNYNDKVSFSIEIDGEKLIKSGTIEIIDKWGTFEDDSDVSYDIMVPNDTYKCIENWDSDGNPIYVSKQGDCFYKHIREDFIINEE